jgi:hypothetical protein
MSDHFICLIPEVPDFIPSKESQAVAAVRPKETSHYSEYNRRKS